MRRFLFLVPAIALVAACDRNPVAPSPAYNISSPPPTARDITVMSQNLYVGANVDLVIRALLTPGPGDDFPALLFAIETVGKTAFPARAEALADESPEHDRMRSASRRSRRSTSTWECLRW